MRKAALHTAAASRGPRNSGLQVECLEATYVELVIGSLNTLILKEALLQRPPTTVAPQDLFAEDGGWLPHGFCWVRLLWRYFGKATTELTYADAAILSLIRTE